MRMVPAGFLRNSLHAARSAPVSSHLGPGRRTLAIMNFDAEILRALRDVREVRIRTEKHPMTEVVIWIVVADDKVFVRSWLGDKGRWYRDLASGGPATLEFAGHRLAAQAIPV